jgi:hypothetical protein
MTSLDRIMANLLCRKMFVAKTKDFSWPVDGGILARRARQDDYSASADPRPSNWISDMNWLPISLQIVNESSMLKGMSLLEGCIMQKSVLLLLFILIQTENQQSQTSNPKANPEEIEKLITQLGDRKFAIREAASKTLENMGLKALPALRKAATAAADAEVRRRAGNLVRAIEKEHEAEIEFAWFDGLGLADLTKCKFVRVATGDYYHERDGTPKGFAKWASSCEMMGPSLRFSTATFGPIPTPNQVPKQPSMKKSGMNRGIWREKRPRF